MTTNFDLTGWCESSDIKLDGVIASNELCNMKKKKNMNFIINLQDSDNKGSHWVALIKRGVHYVYFDSFGAIPDTYVIRYKGKYKLAYSNFIVQDMESDRCGIFCVAFLHYIQTNKGNIHAIYNDFVNLFEHNTRNNDDILKEYIRINKL